MFKPVLYYVTAGAVYACIFIICILALIYGLRARANVKQEKITALPRGFSPMDVQRIFIGKSYPRRLTRALIVHWAQLGYVRVRAVNRFLVRLTCVKVPPDHRNGDAVFYDRGTYVRERDVFRTLMSKSGAEVTVNIYKPLITRTRAKNIYDRYATREDEGIYSAKHYTLKVITFILSLLPIFLCAVYLCFLGNYAVLLVSFFMLIGMFVFRFVTEIPFLFRLVWSFIWVSPAIALSITMFGEVRDPLGLAYAAVAAVFIGGFLLIRFVDYRERNNLSDYSDLINYKKFLLYARRKELEATDYYAALPYIYAFGIKPLVKRKFAKSGLPLWYSAENGKGGGLL